MTDRPILFSAPMIRALLDGRKTQTRQVLKQQPIGPITWFEHDPELSRWLFFSPEKGYSSCHPPYSVGDRLWVREAWRPAISAVDPWHVAVSYAADRQVKHWSWSSDAYFGDWIIPKQAAKGDVPSIHMPRWASRLTLIVTDVRVQRLQDISRGDAMDEGCPYPNMADGPDPRDWFADLWDSINGPDAWDANPWVAAYTFTVHKQNIDALRTDHE